MRPPPLLLVVESQVDEPFLAASLILHCVQGLRPRTRYRTVMAFSWAKVDSRILFPFRYCFFCIFFSNSPSPLDIVSNRWSSLKEYSAHPQCFEPILNNVSKPDLQIRIRFCEFSSDPDPGFKIWSDSDPVSTSKFNLPLKLAFELYWSNEK